MGMVERWRMEAQGGRAETAFQQAGKYTEVHAAHGAMTSQC